MTHDAPLFGLIEAGGTKFVLGVGHARDTLLRTARIETTDPDETLSASVAFFYDAQGTFGDYAAFGIASFGPIDLDRRSVTWGNILTTPKPGWSGTPLARCFADAFGCPVGFDTDVNAAILAEHRWGAAADLDVAVYVTVGTGIGGGALVHGRPVHGLRHPEMGHMRPARHEADRDFAGVCPFHADCLEGLASGPAIAARWGVALSELPHDHDAHDIVAFYLAQLVIAQQALLSPRRIVFGGGVFGTPGLLGRVQRQAATLSGGYFGLAETDYATLIVAPALGKDAGLLGALALAQGVCR